MNKEAVDKHLKLKKRTNYQFLTDCFIEKLF